MKEKITEELIDDLREQFTKALRVAKKFRPSFRIEGIKFDEFRIRFDLNKHKDFSVGSLCLPAEKKYLIAVFVEVKGHLKGNNRIKTTDMACVLGTRYWSGAQRSGIFHFLTANDGPILLSLIKNLKIAP